MKSQKKISVAILALLITACAQQTRYTDPVDFKVEHEDGTHTYIHRSGRIVDVYGNTKGYIQEVK